MYKSFYFTDGTPHLEDIVAKAEVFTQALCCAFVVDDPSFQLPEYEFEIQYNRHTSCAAVTVRLYCPPVNRENNELFHMLFYHDSDFGWTTICGDAMLSAYHDLRMATCVNAPDNYTQLVSSANIAYLKALEELPDIITVFPHEGVDENGQ